MTVARPRMPLGRRFALWKTNGRKVLRVAVTQPSTDIIFRLEY
jgi:hypothetical protein